MEALVCVGRTAEQWESNGYGGKYVCIVPLAD